MKKLNAIYRRYLFLAWMPLALAGVVGVIFHEFVIHSILTNVILNCIILGTALGGALLMMLRIRAIRQEWQVFEQFVVVDPEPDSLAERMQHKSVASRLLASLGRIRRTQEASAIEQSQIQEELEDVYRVLESRQEAAQYVVGLMIALGLLGTFIGLLETLVAVGNLIGGFATTDPSQDMDKALATLIGNLKYPLTAMGTAFSASMFGLLCSLMLGIMMLSVRAFQVEFLQFARTVVDGITVHAHTPLHEGTPGAHVDDETLWMHRVADLQQSHQNLHGEVREVVLQSKRNEDRQALLLYSVENLVSLAQHTQEKTAAMEEHLSVLPQLLSKTEVGHQWTGQLIETVVQLQRSGDLQHQGLVSKLTDQMSEFVSKTEHAHAEQARNALKTIVGVLDQRLAATEAQSTQAAAVTRSVLQQQQLLEHVFKGFGETNASMRAQMERVHQDSLAQAQVLQEVTRTVAVALAEAKVQVQKLSEVLFNPRSDAQCDQVAYEVAQGTERLERELRVGLSAILSALRDIARATHPDSAQEIS